MKDLKTIYVPLGIGGLIPIYGPVKARELSPKIFEILEMQESMYDETEFRQGDFVYCLDVIADDEDRIKLCYQTLTEEEAEYLSNP